MKQKPKIQFDPTDYDYVDSLDKDGWHWEFTRRNGEYCTAYDEMTQLLKDGDENCKTRKCSSCKIISSRNPCPLSLCFDVQETFKINPFNKKKYFGPNIPDPGLKYHELPIECKPITTIRPVSPLKVMTSREIYNTIRAKWKDNKDLYDQIWCNDPQYGMGTFVVELLAPDPEPLSCIPGQEEHNALFIGICPTATRKELRSAFENVLKKHVREKNKYGDTKQTPDKWKSGLMIWDLRLFKYTCGDVALILGIAKDTVKKQFFRVCELIYNLPYKKIEHHLKYPKTREEDLRRFCNNCPKKPDCKEPCPDKIALAVYDVTHYQRERTFCDIETLQKYAQDNFNPSAYEDELIDKIDKRAS